MVLFACFSKRSVLKDFRPCSLAARQIAQKTGYLQYAGQARARPGPAMAENKRGSRDGKNTIFSGRRTRGSADCTPGGRREGCPGVCPAPCSRPDLWPGCENRNNDLGSRCEEQRGLFLIRNSESVRPGRECDIVIFSGTAVCVERSSRAGNFLGQTFSQPNPVKKTYNRWISRVRRS